MDFTKQLSSRPACTGLFVAAAAMASCSAPTDLSAISTYASTMAQSADSFAAVAADYAASCRRYRTVAAGIVETSSSQTAAFVTTSPRFASLVIPNESPQPGYTLPPNAPIPQPAAAVAPPGAEAGGADPCAAAKSVSLAWTDANGTLLNYVQGLGNLAGVDAVPSPNPSPFVAGLAAAGVSSAATQAVAGLIDSIAAYFENRARERAIDEFLAAVNPNMPGAVGALEQVDADYTIRLESEYHLTINQYNAYARLEMGASKGAGRDRAARRLLRAKSTVEAYLESVNQKLRASADYGAAVEALLRTHEQLYDASRRSASFADYLKIVQTTGEPVVVDLLDLAKAVK